MIDKSAATLAEALSQIKDGATILIGGFGTAGQPAELIDGLIELGLKDLTIVSNNAGNGDYGLAKLLKTGAVKKIICSFPRQSTLTYLMNCIVQAKSNWKSYHRAIWLAVCKPQAWDLVQSTPQQVLVHCWLKAKKPVNIDGKDYVLENPIKADFA
jgi:3-oxoadipate CoA-transferase alpha subunit